MSAAKACTTSYKQRATTSPVHQQHLARDRRLRHHRGPALQIDKKTLDTYQTTSDGGVACATALSPAGQLRIAGIVGAANAPTVVGNLCLPWANPLFNGRGTNQKRKDKEWSGTIKASYRFSPEVFTYASYARGYKGGGFNLDRTQSSNGLPTGGRASCRSTTPRSRPNSSTATSWA
jgi:iron complex outermembrane receptor protein